MEVEVVYALAERQEVVRISIAPGSTAGDAVRASGILARHPELDLARNKIGIYGRVVAPETRLDEGDRVEVYRPLAIDPKEARRRRAVRTRKR